MSADDIYESVKKNIKRLSRREKIKLYSKLISESHPAFRVNKRGRTRSLYEAKRKLKKDIHLALAYQEKESAVNVSDKQL